MKVIAVIEQEDVISRILSHLGLLSCDDPSRSLPGDLAALTAPKDLVRVPVDDDLLFPEAASRPDRTIQAVRSPKSREWR